MNKQIGMQLIHGTRERAIESCLATAHRCHEPEDRSQECTDRGNKKQSSKMNWLQQYWRQIENRRENCCHRRQNNSHAGTKKTKIELDLERDPVWVAKARRSEIFFSILTFFNYYFRNEPGETFFSNLILFNHISSSGATRGADM
jgi:hypothetical protein